MIVVLQPTKSNASYNAGCVNSNPLTWSTGKKKGGSIIIEACFILDHLPEPFTRLSVPQTGTSNVRFG